LSAQDMHPPKNNRMLFCAQANLKMLEFPTQTFELGALRCGLRDQSLMPTELVLINIL